MWSSINQRLKRRWYEHKCADIYATPPIQPRNDGLAIFSMIGTAVMTPYLVAVKSLHHHLNRGRIVIMDDGTLTDQDRLILHTHLGNPQILSIRDVNVGACPRGGTWERLLTILDMSAADYVIQLDSDTVTVGPIPQVLRAIDENRSFTLLGAETQIDSILDVRTFTQQHFQGRAPSKEDREGHIQGATESVLCQLRVAGLDQPSYVRGCSGFAGFMRGGDRRLAEAFSQAASAVLGSRRWAEWGTEQITSNFVIANHVGAKVLPPVLYANYWGSPLNDVRFVHYIGTYRWQGFTYQRSALEAIQALKSA
ncbi:MAG: hypothetical protein QHC67_01325 [Sphingobium sp.]|uniref:hypothetical protein n=1 Tax=Sphingobium sp. TaxID=1912891 RepID=UPI0029BA1A18|nr:hypothetical protein [Sphingobium sp.]MDX3908448.1 hypothetical protein [Sphingobium sp.]